MPSSQFKRVFIIVLDSFGIGELPDADLFGDTGSNTLTAIAASPKYDTPELKKLGLFNIDGVGCGEKCAAPTGSFARMAEKSMGKDTTTGHWEIAGIETKKAMPTYPNGFPEEIIKALEQKTGKGVLCNKPYSGTKVIVDYGPQHMKTGKLIVYTSSDSVFQIAAHEDVVPVEKLYEYCSFMRNVLTGENSVGRVIARPFRGTYPNFERTSARHDFSLEPPQDTMLDILKQNKYDVIAVGKINDIFAGRGVTKFCRTVNNMDGMDKTLEIQKEDFNGLCFVNLVDFDMIYGHRNNVDGYANAMTEFDRRLGEFLSKMREGDALFITADHGCDPSTPSTDHSREYTPMIVCGSHIKKGINLHTRPTFGDIGATILDMFSIDEKLCGNSFKNEIES